MCAGRTGTAPVANKPELAAEEAGKEAYQMAIALEVAEGVRYVEFHLIEWGVLLVPCPGCSVYPCQPGQLNGHHEKLRTDNWCRGQSEDLTMKGRYLLLIPRDSAASTWRRTWHSFAELCRSVHLDGLVYSVTFRLADVKPHVLITAEGTSVPRKPPASHRTPKLPAIRTQCRNRALEVEWFLPENQNRPNDSTTYWRTHQSRYRELSRMAEDSLRVELEYWRELELLSGLREHFKPGGEPMRRRTPMTRWRHEAGNGSLGTGSGPGGGRCSVPIVRTGSRIRPSLQSGHSAALISFWTSSTLTVPSRFRSWPAGITPRTSLIISCTSTTLVT